VRTVLVEIEGGLSMLDLFYLLVGAVVFAALWGIAKACDRA
jgi:hypothetical protein